MKTIVKIATVNHVINKENCPDCWGYVEYNNELRGDKPSRVKAKLGWIVRYARHCLGLK